MPWENLDGEGGVICSVGIRRRTHWGGRGKRLVPSGPSRQLSLRGGDRQNGTVPTE